MSRFKTPKDPEVLPVKPIESVRDLIDKLPNEGTKRILLRGLHDLDIQNIDSLRKVLSVCEFSMQLTLAIAPTGKDAQKTCELVIKNASLIKDVYCMFADRELPEEIRKQNEAILAQIMDALKGMVNEDQFAKLERVLESTNPEDVDA